MDQQFIQMGRLKSAALNRKISASNYASRVGSIAPSIRSMKTAQPVVGILKPAKSYSEFPKISPTQVDLSAELYSRPKESHTFSSKRYRVCKWKFDSVFRVPYMDQEIALI